MQVNYSLHRCHMLLSHSAVDGSAGVDVQLCRVVLYSCVVATEVCQKQNKYLCHCQQYLVCLTDLCHTNIYNVCRLSVQNAVLERSDVPRIFLVVHRTSNLQKILLLTFNTRCPLLQMSMFGRHLIISAIVTLYVNVSKSTIGVKYCQHISACISQMT